MMGKYGSFTNNSYLSTSTEGWFHPSNADYHPQTSIYMNCQNLFQSISQYSLALSMCRLSEQLEITSIKRRGGQNFKRRLRQSLGILDESAIMENRNNATMIQLSKLLRLEIIFTKLMRPDNYEYLSRSAVGSAVSFKKSPDKYGYYDPKPEEYANMERSLYTPSRKQWNPLDYNGVKKGSNTPKDLRQTFESRTNNKLQQTFSKSSYSFKDQPVSVAASYDFSKSQYSTKPTNQSGYDLTSSTNFDRGFRKQPSNNYTSKYDTVKSPNEKRIDIDEKFKFYVDAVQKFKEQADVTSKMSQQLKKLKQDRKKRLQAREKQKQAQIYRETKQLKQKQKEKDTFKKKTSYQYYSPKEEKTVVVDKYNSDSKTLNLDKYKSYTSSQFTTKQQPKKKTTSKYDQYLETKNTATLNSPSSTSALISKKSQSVSMFNGEIKDFILGKLLGQGKFGTVYQAFHKPTRSLFAIKKIPKEMIKSHLMVDQFCLQIKLQMFLNHENILTLFHFFDDRTHIYLVLEYMEEGTLFTHLKKNRKLPEPEVAIKIKQIASAVKYLHQNQIAHRDIKPENIVMSHGVCKLCDFGWATVCDERRKTYCGTFDYAPPQILAGAEYDYTVDLWCLGVLTYELLVGKAPFYHISRKETMKKILNVEKTVLEYPENISKDAISFIDNLIKKDPKQRISSDQILNHPFLKYAPTKAKFDLRKGA